MPYSIRTKDGITINNIPDDVAPDSDVLKQRVAQERAKLSGAVQQPSPQQLTGEVPVLPEQQGMVPQEPVQAAPERTMGERVMGGIEAAAATTIGGIPAMIGQGVGAAQGAVEYLGRGDFSQPPADLVQQRAMEGAQRLSLTPPSEAGREYTQAVGEALAPVGGAMAGLAPVSTGVGRAISQSAKSAAQVPGAVVPERLANIKVPRFERQKIADVRQALAENTTESVGWKLKGNTVTPNMIERDLLDAGIKDQTIIGLRTLAKQDKPSALRTLDLMEDYVKGKEGSDISRPSMVAGEQIMRRFEKLKNVQEKASQKIGNAVRKDLMGKPVDVTDIRDDFMFKIGERGVDIVDGRPVFRDLASFEKTDRPFIGEIYRTLNRNFDNAEELHRIKQSIAARLYNQKAAPLSDAAKRVAESVRARINEKLRSMSDDYAAANDEFSTAVAPLKAFEEAVGKKKFAEIMGRDLDLESTRIANFTGTQLRKVLSNYNNADQIIDAVRQLNDVANQFEGVKFGNEVIPLVRLNTNLENVFGSPASQSLKGIGQEIAQQMPGRLGAAKEVMEAGKRYTSLWDAPVKDKLEVINKLREQVKSQ